MQLIFFGVKNDSQIDYKSKRYKDLQHRGVQNHEKNRTYFII